MDGVLHLASLASPKDYLEHPIETLDVGSAGTRNMLEIARQHQARFMVTSTSECYGDPLVHPQVETYWGNVNPVGLRSCYDESKRYAEALTMAYHRVHGVRTTIARIFNTYGPRMQLNDGRVVPAFIDQALHGEPMTVFGDGTQTRSFCYVRDLVDGLYRLTLSDERYPVNLGNPQELTILEFAERIRRLTGTTAAARIQAAPAGRSQAAAAEHRQGQKDAGLGAEGQSGRRAEGDDRVFPEPAFAGSGALTPRANFNPDLRRGGFPQLHRLARDTQRQRVVVIGRHHAHHGARMNPEAVQIFEQPPVAFEDADHDGIRLGRRFIERTQTPIAAILRRVALHAIAVRARLAGAQLFEQSPLEIGRDGVLQLLGFVVDLVPLHAENLGEHALDQMMPVQQPVGDIAARPASVKVVPSRPARISASRFRRLMAMVTAGAETFSQRARVAGDYRLAFALGLRNGLEVILLGYGDFHAKSNCIVFASEA